MLPKDASKKSTSRHAIADKATPSQPMQLEPVQTDWMKSLDSLSNQPGDVVGKATTCINLLMSIGIQASNYFAASTNGELRLCASKWSGSSGFGAVSPTVFNNFCRTCSQQKTRLMIVEPESPNKVCLFFPIVAGSKVADVLTLTLESTPELLATNIRLPVVEQLVTALQLWKSKNVIQTQDSELHRMAALIELVGLIETADSLESASCTLVNELRKFTGSHIIGLGLCGKQAAGAKLVAISGLTHFDKHSDLAQTFQTACDEGSRQKEVTCWPPLNPRKSVGTISLRRLAESQNVECVVAAPLRSHSKIVGVLIVGGGRSLMDARSTGLLETASEMLGMSLSQIRQLQKNALARNWQRLKESHWSRRIALATSLILIGGLMLMPVPQQIKVECSIEPVTRRIVGAPFDGILQTTNVRAGEVVEQGSLLASMDTREIRLELSTLQSERTRYNKEYDKELAAGQVAKARIAQTEATRIQQKIELLETREAKHQIRTPLSGMILTGELQNLSGSVVKMGQPLFEIAKLNPVRVELEVPAEDYFYIKVGQQVELRFEGYLPSHVTGTVELIRPRSEIRDARNVFVAELQIDNAMTQLRPGLKGYASIEAERHPLAWNLFHKAWEAVWRLLPG